MQRETPVSSCPASAGTPAVRRAGAPPPRPIDRFVASSSGLSFCLPYAGLSSPLLRGCHCRPPSALNCSRGRAAIPNAHADSRGSCITLNSSGIHRFEWTKRCGFSFPRPFFLRHAVSSAPRRGSAHGNCNFPRKIATCPCPQRLAERREPAHAMPTEGKRRAVRPGCSAGPFYPGNQNAGMVFRDGFGHGIGRIAVFHQATYLDCALELDALNPPSRCRDSGRPLFPRPSAHAAPAAAD